MRRARAAGDRRTRCTGPYDVNRPAQTPFTHHTVTHAGLTAERVAVVLFGLNLTLAALMVYLVIRHASRTPGLAADDMAEEELQAFARERRAAALLQASATIVGVFLPATAVVFYLAVSVLYIVEPLWHIRIRIRRPTKQG